MSISDGAHRARVRKLLIIKQRGRCHWCGCGMKTRGDPNASDFATLEHLIPKSHGGRNVKGNLVLACRRCNNDRGAPEPVMTAGPQSGGGGAMAEAFARAGLVAA